MNTVTIRVTKKDIQVANASRKTTEYNSNSHCPICQSLKRTGHSNVRSYFGVVNFDEKEYSLPKKADSFQLAFVGRDTLKPITFKAKLK